VTALWAVGRNPVLWAGLLAMLVAQGLKPVFLAWRGQGWQWRAWFAPGGMPSSHAALVAAAAHTVGLQQGFDSPLFGLAVVLAMIVVYDATGVRRAAGEHAARINRMLDEWQHGVWDGPALREVLGHTPWEVMGGLALGLLVAQALAWWAARSGIMLYLGHGFPG